MSEAIALENVPTLGHISIAGVSKSYGKFKVLDDVFTGADAGFRDGDHRPVRLRQVHPAARD